MASPLEFSSPAFHVALSQQGPRIYNLLPTLAGPFKNWDRHLHRCRDMGFNWVFLNPVHQPGFSGSIYAVRDYYALNPLLQGDAGDGWAAFRSIVNEADKLGMKVAVDLVLNHTSKDSVLVEEHPDWFERDADGKLVSPGAGDPDSPGSFKKWGDLAAINHLCGGQAQELQWRYWLDLVNFLQDQGVRGFRCDAAYQVPTVFWRYLISEAKARVPQSSFWAENLGAPLEDALGLREAGFDFFFNSSKWWDFEEDWCLEQYDAFRAFTRTISFPESHDTSRLATELRRSERKIRQRYLFACCFSAGVMLPMGFEYGFRNRFHVVKTEPKDWETPIFDLRDFIADCHETKKACRALNEEGPIRRVSYKGVPVHMFYRESSDGASRCLLLVNTDFRKKQIAEYKDLEALLGCKVTELRDLTPTPQAELLMSPYQWSLRPGEMRIIANPNR